MQALDILKKLDSKAVFHVQDIERIANANRPYARLILNRLKERGLIKKIAENSYTTKDDINAIASNIVFPSYISFWYASYFLGYTEQIVNTVHVATTVKKKTVKFENYEIKFVPIKHFFGYRKIRTNQGDIFIAEDEKLLIDALLRPRECGNFDEIKKIFKRANINNEKLAEYLNDAGNQNIIKKVGYLLEKLRRIDLSEDFALDKNYAILNPFSGKWNKIDRKWRVRI